MPHWQIGGSWYFITFLTKTGFILSDRARDIVCESILNSHQKMYLLSIAVAMPDHVHMIIQPLMKDDESYFTLTEIMKSTKGVSARKINLSSGREGSIWHRESFDRIIRDDDEWFNKHDYISNNAVKAGLVEKPEEYKWLVGITQR